MHAASPCCVQPHGGQGRLHAGPRRPTLLACAPSPRACVRDRPTLPGLRFACPGGLEFAAHVHAYARPQGGDKLQGGKRRTTAAAQPHTRWLWAVLRRRVVVWWLSWPAPGGLPLLDAAARTRIGPLGCFVRAATVGTGWPLGAHRFQVWGTHCAGRQAAFSRAASPGPSLDLHCMLRTGASTGRSYISHWLGLPSRVERATKGGATALPPEEGAAVRRRPAGCSAPRLAPVPRSPFRLPLGRFGARGQGPVAAYACAATAGGRGAAGPQRARGRPAALPLARGARSLRRPLPAAPPPVINLPGP